MSKTAHSFSSKHRTSDVLNDENLNVDFASLLLSPDVLSGLSQAGFERPSPIQLKAIPLGRCGLDLIVQAKSGTGKTCVFAVVILEGLDLRCAGLQALVLAPTREIAAQSQAVVQSVGSAMPALRCHTFIGGTLLGPDRQKLKKCHVAVGTPGRVKQLIEYGVMVTDSIRLFVLDEADKLLDDKFQDQVNWIYNRLPVNKQMLALSATYPESLARGLTAYMRDPTFVRLHPRNVSLKGIRQFYKVVTGHWLHHKAFEVKVQHLLQLLSSVNFSQCLVFSNLSSRAKNLSDVLCQQGWPSTCISSSQNQGQRNSAMAMLKAFQCRVLISTDLTARGIDAENVNLIVNLDVPADGKTYMHRIGRAGRFGSRGVAVTLASEGREECLLRSVKRQCRVRLQLLPEPMPADLVTTTDGTWDNQEVDVEEEEEEERGEEKEEKEREEEEKEKEEEDSSYSHSKSWEVRLGEVQTKGPGEGAKGTQDLTTANSAGNPSSAGGRPTGQSSVRGSTGRTSCQRSHPGQALEASAEAAGKTREPGGVMDQSCQADTLCGLLFDAAAPSDVKIPSLGAILRPPGMDEARWTWQQAARDFEEFTSGQTGSTSQRPHLRVEGAPHHVQGTSVEIANSLSVSNCNIGTKNDISTPLVESTDTASVSECNIGDEIEISRLVAESTDSASVSRCSIGDENEISVPLVESTDSASVSRCNIGDKNEISVPLVESTDSASASKCNIGDDDEISRTAEDAGVCGSIVHAVHKLQIGAPAECLPLPDGDRDTVTFEEDTASCHTAWSSGGGSILPKDDDRMVVISDSVKVTESCRKVVCEEKEKTCDQTSGVDAIPNGGDSGQSTPASQTELVSGVAHQVLCEREAVDDANGDRLAARGSTADPKTKYKVQFSWQPTKDFFSDLTSACAAGVLGEDEDELSDTSSTDGSTDAQSDAAGAEPEHFATGLTNGGELKAKGSASGSGKPMPAATDAATSAKRIQPGAPGDATPAELHGTCQQPDLLKPSVRRKTFLGMPHRPAHSLGQSRPSKQVTDASHTPATEAPPANAAAPVKKPAADRGPPGSDPTWQHYTDFLGSLDATSDETSYSSCENSCESDASGDASSDSPEEAPHLSPGDHPTKGPDQKRHPDSPLEFYTAHPYNNVQPGYYYHWPPGYNTTGSSFAPNNSNWMYKQWPYGYHYY